MIGQESGARRFTSELAADRRLDLDAFRRVPRVRDEPHNGGVERVLGLGKSWTAAVGRAPTPYSERMSRVSTTRHALCRSWPARFDVSIVPLVIGGDCVGQERQQRPGGIVAICR